MLSRRNITEFLSNSKNIVYFFDINTIASKKEEKQIASPQIDSIITIKKSLHNQFFSANTNVRLNNYSVNTWDQRIVDYC